MGPEFHDLIEHHRWATNQLLTFCRDLPPGTLDATVPGTYGSIIQTLRHLIDAETSYTYRLTGAWERYPWNDDAAGGPDVGLDVLAERATAIYDVLQPFLASAWDSERLGEARGDEGEVFAVRAGVFLTQLLHHANEHRAQVCTILGALGYEVPDVSAWGYASASGRSWQTTPPANS